MIRCTRLVAACPEARLVAALRFGGSGGHYVCCGRFAERSRFGFNFCCLSSFADGLEAFEFFGEQSELFREAGLVTAEDVVGVGVVFPSTGLSKHDGGAVAGVDVA